MHRSCSRGESKNRERERERGRDATFTYLLTLPILCNATLRIYIWLIILLTTDSFSNSRLTFAAPTLGKLASWESRVFYTTWGVEWRCSCFVALRSRRGHEHDATDRYANRNTKDKGWQEERMQVRMSKRSWRLKGELVSCQRDSDMYRPQQ